MSRFLDRSLDRLKLRAGSSLRSLADALERVGSKETGAEAPVVIPDPRPSAVLHMATPTHFGNLMIRYMVAQKLVARCAGMAISNVHMPYWNIDLPSLQPRHDRCLRILSEQHIPFNRIGYYFDEKLFYRFEWYGYGQRMENFPDKDLCRGLFRTEIEGVRLGDDCIACPIRGGEVLHAVHPGYTTVPVDFYSEIVEETGLRPVFFGQLEDNSFTRSLRDRFPQGEFLPKQGFLEDFQTIRNAQNILLPISTFAWLAAWLSDAKQVILPVFGIFDPAVFGLHDLLPLGERAYQFYQFPPEPAVALDDLEEAHSRMKGQWRKVDRFSLVLDYI